MKNLIICIASVLLSSCATDPGSPKTAPAELVFYRCEYDIAFTVRFADDSAIIDSSRGYEVLYRNAKDLTPPSAPKSDVYGNRRMRAEFGLGATGKEALLTYSLAPLVVRCSRD